MQDQGTHDSALSKREAFLTTCAARGPLRPATWLARSIIGHTLLSPGDDISAFRVQLHGRTGVFQAPKDSFHVKFYTTNLA